MKKQLLSLTSLILVVCMLFTTIPVSAAVLDRNENANNTSVDNVMSISSTNSLGAMIADELGEEQEKQEENNGINIFSVELEGKTATAEIETVMDAVLVVGIYSEDGVEMYATGKTEIAKGDEIAQVTIDIDTMPQFFYLKAYIVEPESLKPLCTVYESPNYTQEMQEFFAKTVEDFDEEKVLNLDGDETNNFAVYNDDVKLIESTSDSANELVSSDDDQKVYVIENADDSITSLQEGDIFSYAYDDDNVIIVKVKSIAVDGTTATIVGDDAELNEIFDYFRVDEGADFVNSNFDSTEMDDALEIEEGHDEDNGKNPEPVGATSIDGSQGATLSYNIDTDKKTPSESGPFHGSAKVKGSIGLSLVGKVKIYVSLTYQYIEIGIDYSLKLSLSVSLTGSAKFPMGYFAIMFCGIIIEFTPSFVVECKGILETSGTLSGSVGLSASLQKGIKNTSKSPTFKAEVKAEITIFIGLSLCPKVKVLHNVITGSLDARLGAEIKATLKTETESGNSVAHDCTYCVSGTISAKLSLTFELKFLNSNRLRMTFQLLNLTFKICDFYWSLDHMTFGFTTCPYKKYLSTMIVQDSCKSPIKDARITFGDKLYTTNEQGIVKVYLSCGNYDITATKDNHSLIRHVEVTDRAVTTVFLLEMITDGSGNGSGSQSGSGSSWEESGDLDNGVPIYGNIKAVETGSAHSAALTKDGTLYMWGSDSSGQLGDGSAGTSFNRPRKVNSSIGIPEHSVKQVSLGSNHSAAVTFDGSLYTWGSNTFGQLGDGTTVQKTRPVKIMDNVKSVSLGGSFSAAITTDNSLYTWGDNENGKLGNGSTAYWETSPQKIMENVKSVSLGKNHGAAITVDGTLYLWGHNGYGQIGNGQIYQTQSSPVKIMEHVKLVSLGEGHSAAVTINGDLFTWGYNSGRLGDGTLQQRTEPVKIATNVRLVSLGSGYSTAVSNDGALYTWGGNDFGQLGTELDSNIPQMVCNNIASVSAGGGGSYFGTTYYTPANHNAHTLALTMDGRVLACGKNYNGQLGNGISSENPRPIPENINSSFEEISIQDYTLTFTASATKKSVESVGASANKTTRFSGLKAGAIYNFYSLKTKSVEDILNGDNLLYITQAEADENGNLFVSYNPKEEYITPYEFVASMTHIDLSETTVTDASVTYNGTVQRYNPTIKYGNYTLYENIDYQLNGIYSALNAGEYAVEITGKGDFVGSLTKTFTINKADVNKTDVVGLENQEYTGEPITPDFIVKDGSRTLTKDSDYTVKYQSATDLGLGIVEIKGIGNYSGRKVCWFEISEGDISAYGTCCAIKYQLYTGSELTPEPTVTMNGNTLVEGTDYTVEYKNNSAVGTATIVVKGIGNYTGMLATTFEIIDEQVGDVDLDKNVNINDVTVIQRHLAELEALDEKKLALADTNGDGQVDIADATYLQMYLAEYGVVLEMQA